MADILRTKDGDLVVRDGDLAIALPIEEDTRQLEYIVRTEKGNDLTDRNLGMVKDQTRGVPLTRSLLTRLEAAIQRALLYKAAFLPQELLVLGGALNATQAGIFIQLNREYDTKLNSPWLTGFMYDFERGTESSLDGVQR